MILRLRLRCLSIVYLAGTLGMLSLISGKAYREGESRTANVPVKSTESPASMMTPKRSANRAGAETIPGGWRAPFAFGSGTSVNVSPMFVPNISATKSATLGTDVNSNGFVNPGDTLTYSVVVTNTGTDATNVVFADQLDANLTLIGAATGPEAIRRKAATG